MADVAFIIPQKLEDLCTYKHDRYVVATDYNADEVNVKIAATSNNQLENGPSFILEDFDILYGVLKHFDTIADKSRDVAWKTMYKAADQLLRELQDELNDTISDEVMFEKRKKCNILKMLMYVFCALIIKNEESEQRKGKEQENQAVGKGQRKKQITTSPDWDRQRDRAIDLLMKISVMSLHRLFTPPVVEDEFMDLITRVCYKIFESQTAMKKDSLKNHLFQILANAVSKHKHSLNFCVKSVQLMQQKDFLVKDIASLVELMVKSHGQKQIVGEILTEMDRIDMSKDNSGTKNVAEFLREVAEKVPKAMIGNVSCLFDFLDRDAYMIRSATISALGSIVSLELSDPDSPVKVKRLRDELLDKLEDHILDVATYTRGRVISVWTRLCQEGKIPLSRLETLIEAIVNRLRDKAVYVRKQTIIFLTEFLKQNPFAAKLPLDRLKQAYIKEKDRLDRLGEGPAEAGDHNNGPNNSSPEDLEADWKRIEQDLLDYWSGLASQSDADSEDESSPDPEIDMSAVTRIEQVAGALRQLIQDKKYKASLDLVKQLKNKFPKSSIFSTGSDEYSDSSSSDMEDDEDPIPSRKSSTSLPASVKAAKRIFLLQKERNVVNRDDVRQIEGVARDLVQQGDSQQGDEVTDDDVVTDIGKQQVLVKYLKDCVTFAEHIRTAIPLVCTMLYSASISDSQEAIDFFVTAHEFAVQGSIIGIRKMIILVFGDKAVRDAVIAAYKQVYLNSSSLADLNHRQKSLTVVKSLMELVEGANVGERLSLQELLRHLMETGDIHADHTKILFEKFALKLPGTSEAESRIAVHLIGMLASANRRLILDNFDTLITVGLGTRASNDSQLVEQTCIALQKAAIESPKVEDVSHSYRLDRNHKLFIELNRLLTDGLVNIEDPHYIPMADEAIRTIYKLAEHPDAICGDILRDMLRYILSCDPNSSDSSKENEEMNRQSAAGSQFTSTQLSTQADLPIDLRVPSDVLCRFISVSGNVALNQLIHIESSVLTEIKIRKQLKEVSDAKKKSSKNRQQTSSRKAAGSTRHSSLASGTPTGMEEEIGLAGASAVDDEIEQFRINRIIDDPRNMLHKLAPLVVYIVTHHEKFPDPKLKTAASLTLAKFMCCSQRFCADHLRLLFTILQKSEEPVIRQNAIISLGDLCVRFPNLLDSWTPKLYMPLNDADVEVRRNALKVLSRLILSDMVKVRGQISELAKIVVDDDDSLASLARLFFNELKKKENAIYNVLPDIISNLSGGEVEMDEHKFQTVMKFLFSLIEKDRQTQCLVEKLCQRFRATLVERQWRDLTFCLTIMSFSDKSVNKLYEHLGAFADKLTCEAVYEGIKSIIAAAQKMPGIRAEFKQTLDEFAGKVEECRNKGISMEDESEIAKVVGTPPSASKRGHHAAAPTPGTSRATADRMTAGKKTTKKSVAKKTTAKKTSRRRKKEDSDEDEDEDEREMRGGRSSRKASAGKESQQPVRQSSRVTRAKQDAKKLFEVSEDEDESDE